MTPWELLFRRMLWHQLDFVANKKVLDFGSGEGITANYFAGFNEVTAIEPDEEILQQRIAENEFQQIKGGLEALKQIPDENFDIILCHNVLEYAFDERAEILKEFERMIKKDGKISIVKHNKIGRIMQMTVLLNNFTHAKELLDGQKGQAYQYGVIDYFHHEEILNWAPSLEITKNMGIRAFWDLQQNQEIQKEADWQDAMLELEMRVSEIEAFRNIAFFHHLILQKKK